MGASEPWQGQAEPWDGGDRSATKLGMAVGTSPTTLSFCPASPNPNVVLQGPLKHREHPCHTQWCWRSAPLLHLPCSPGAQPWDKAPRSTPGDPVVLTMTSPLVICSEQP